LYKKKNQTGDTNMKRITLFLVLTFCLALIGCSKDAEIATFMTEWEGVTNDMVKKIDAGDVDGAKAAFDGKKDALKAKWADVKTARGFQVSADTQKKMTDGATKNMGALTASMTKNVMKLAGDKTKMDKLQALIKEYGDIFQ
jgi:hypothetical protein